MVLNLQQDKNTHKTKSNLLLKMTREKRNLLIGEIVSLMLCSQLHTKYSINDIGSVFFPPIDHNQFKIYKNQDGNVVGLITWAFLSDEVAAKYQIGEYNLKPEDWNNGDQGWVIDFIAPFGHAKTIMSDIRNNVFPNQIGKAIRAESSGKIRGIIKLQGKNVVKNAS